MPQTVAGLAGRRHSDSASYHRTRPLSFADNGAAIASPLTTCTRVRSCEPGQHLFRAGDDVRSLYVVHSGAFKNYLTSEDGDAEQVLGFFLPGEILGLDAVKSRRYGCSAVALESSSAYDLSLQHLHKTTTSAAESNDPLTDLYTSAVARDYIALWILSKKAVDQRLAGFLLDLSQRYTQHGFTVGAYHLCMSRRDIGDYLGLALGTVSRLFSEFEAKGFVAVQRRDIRLLHMQALRTLAGNCPWPA